MSLLRRIKRVLARSRPGQSALARYHDRRDRAIVERYLANHEIRLLQIGTGGNELQGWLNTEYYPVRALREPLLFLDATRRFPFAAEIFDRVFSEHVIEHLPFGAGRRLVEECFRVLKPGGRIRISTPDMEFLTGLLAGDLYEEQRAYVAWSSSNLTDGQPATPLSVVNNFVRDWGHTYIYDKPTLERLLEESGFDDIRFHRIGESDDPLLKGLECPQRYPEPYFLQLETMTAEATKPR